MSKIKKWTMVAEVTAENAEDPFYGTQCILNDVENDAKYH